MSFLFSARFNQTWVAQTVYNVTHWEFDGTATSEDVIPAFVEEIRDLFDEFLSFFHTSWGMSGVTTREFDGGGAFTIEHPFTTPLVGTGTGTTMPTQLAPITRLTAVAPPPNRGRIYWCGAPTGSLTTGGIISNTWINGYTAIVDAMVEGFAIEGGVARLVIARPDYANNVFLGWHRIDGFLTLPIYGTQRRRRIGEGI